ncbi:MAG: hypothetical protein LIP05_14455, partial [Tannerellaceae bacterium]|nr:hypothetical protein [Tannerellaceae bacterium]
VYMKRIFFIAWLSFLLLVPANGKSVRNAETGKLYSQLKQLVADKQIMFGMANPTTIGFTTGPHNPTTTRPIAKTSPETIRPSMKVTSCGTKKTQRLWNGTSGP